MPTLVVLPVWFVAPGGRAPPADRVLCEVIVREVSASGEGRGDNNEGAESEEAHQRGRFVLPREGAELRAASRRPRVLHIRNAVRTLLQSAAPAVPLPLLGEAQL